MGAPYVLRMMTPLANVSPFDVNMAVDAGIDTVVPYTGIETAQVEALTQDAMFSRDPKNAARTGLFIGGRNAAMALDMLEVARKAMFQPFEISVFADPSCADLSCADTSTGGKAALMERAEVVLACGKAGVTVLTADDLRAARRLRVAADINAVPPAGVEGIGVQDEGAPLPGHSGAVGIGALAFGNVKFKVQHHLLERMQTGGIAVAFDFKDAMDAARTIAGTAK